jgi:hypothetical protein
MCRARESTRFVFSTATGTEAEKVLVTNQIGSTHESRAKNKIFIFNVRKAQNFTNSNSACATVAKGGNFLRSYRITHIWITGMGNAGCCSEYCRTKFLSLRIRQFDVRVDRIK